MRIGIIGAGNIGLAVAKTLSRAGIAATIANSRGPDSLKEAVAALGPTIKAGTREQAAAADIVLIAVNWSKLPAAVAGLPAWDGRIVIDANNPIEAPLFKPVDLHGRISSEMVAELVKGARLVKAFNHLRAEILASDPRADGGRRVLFYSGDDSVAKADGKNGLTRARFLEEAAKVHDFTASVDGDAMLGPTDVGGHKVSPCFLLMRVKGNRYVRVFPKQANTFDCNPKNVFTIKLDQS